MGMPTDEELRQALTEAARMREEGKDPQHIAKALLSLHYRMRYLEKVLEVGERYLKFGLSAHEHAEFQRAVDEARQAIARNRGSDEGEASPI